MEIELRHLSVVVALADHGSVAAAAEGTGQRPQAVAAALHRLEDHFGAALFAPAVPRRLRRGSVALEPTAAGRGVLRRARRAMAAAEAAQDVVRRLQRRSSTVRLHWSVLPFEALRSFLVAVLPDVRWEARADTAADAVAAIAAGDADMFYGLTVSGDEEWVLPPGLVSHLVVEETPSLVLPRTHPRAADDVVDLAQLAASHWALPAEPALERLVRDACRRSGFEPRIQFRTDDTASVMQLVESGQAVSITSPVMAEGARTVLRRCRQIPSVQWVVIHRRHGVESRVAHALIDVARGGYATLAAQVPDLEPPFPREQDGVVGRPGAATAGNRRAGLPARPVRLGSVAHPAVAELVAGLHDRAVLSIVTSPAPDGPAALLEAVRGGVIDLALGHDTPFARAEPVPAVVRRTLVEAEPVFVAVGPGHPLAGKESLTAGEAADLEWVETPSSGGFDAPGFWSAVGLEPDVRERTIGLAATAELLLGHDLAALVPATSYDERLHHVRLDHPLAQVRYFLAWRPDRITDEVVDPVAAEFHRQLHALAERVPRVRGWLADNPGAVAEP